MGPVPHPFSITVTVNSTDVLFEDSITVSDDEYQAHDPDWLVSEQQRRVDNYVNFITNKPLEIFVEDDS